MEQPVLSEEAYKELAAQLGRINGKFTKDPFVVYAGDSIHGLMVTDPNYGSTTYQARFPCRQPATIGRWPRREKYETSIDIRHLSSLETEWGAGYKIGCIWASTDVFLPQYPGGPQQFARALQSVTRVPIEWHFVEMELTKPEPVHGYGLGTPWLQEPVDTSINPPLLLVHQDHLVKMRQAGEDVIGTGQLISSPVATLVSIYDPSVRVPVHIRDAQAMDGWYRYDVVAA